MQTRRNDSRAGVENRALWTVRQITPAGVELASVNDSIDIRLVSHDYAADHLHLAYASTVHGIQGETTDASIVGPGVDAAGLYVGMTRGRAHNEAVVIATTDAAAREKIADSMLRGTPEVTIDDSLRAALTELGRAARTPANAQHLAPPSRTDDRPPHGHVANIDRALGVCRQRERGITSQLGRGGEWLRATARSLLASEASRATRDAVAHARPSVGGLPGGEDQPAQRLHERYLARLREHGDLAEALRRQSRVIDVLEAERSVRASLSADALVAEDRARRSAAHKSDAPIAAMPVVFAGDQYRDRGPAPISVSAGRAAMSSRTHPELVPRGSGCTEPPRSSQQPPGACPTSAEGPGSCDQEPTDRHGRECASRESRGGRRRHRRSGSVV